MWSSDPNFATLILSFAVSRLGDGSRYPEIKKLNGLKGDTIYTGQKLKIPGTVNSLRLKVGDKVRITASHYATGEVIPAWVRERTHAVSQIEESKVLLGWPDGIASRVSLDGVKKI